MMTFIQKKSQEILLHVEEPEQKKAYYFWQIIELRCKYCIVSLCHCGGAGVV